MLTRIISRCFPLKNTLPTRSLKFNFGAAKHEEHHDEHHDQHDDHHHHDYSVHIDKNATWIKYKTNRKMACVEGIVDTHYFLKDPDNSDPFTHLKENSALSAQNLIYNDPYYHEDDHEPFVNEPHGYAAGSDPIDTRFDIVVPNVLAMATIGGLLLIILFLEEHPYLESILYREKLAIEYVEGNLEGKNNELNEIKNKIKQLSAQ